jgi:GTPase Era involved in 16S rRNA processing
MAFNSQSIFSRSGYPMNQSLEALRVQLDSFRKLLREATFLSLTHAERSSLAEEANLLSLKLTSVEASFLTVGLLGGTGVGKSTIMNALAGSEIASASHRRPHTDRILIYRHAKSHPLLHEDLGALPWSEITHEADRIRHILLCDLPDFDSLVGAHRKSVLEFLEHLDILVWVSSPEKYGDGRFYEFLGLVPKARENFIFVLNKVDLLFQDKTPEKGYEQLDRVFRGFEEHIRGQGAKEPLIFTISAIEASGSQQLSTWNRFVGFRREIFQQRDVKQIAAVKTANLDVEIQRFLSSFEKEARNLETFVGILEDSLKYLETERPSWFQAGRDAFQLWLEDQAKPGLLEYQGEPFALVGPGYVIALAFNLFHGRGTNDVRRTLDASSFKPSEGIISVFERRFDWVEEHMGHAILQRNLAPSFLEKLKEHLNAKRNLEALRISFHTAVAAHADESAPSRFWGFRFFQWVVYLVVLVLFLFAIGGEKAWQDVLNHPGTAQVMGLVLSMIHNLFDTKGLAALGSYALINLFLGFRFYRRYRKIVQKGAQRKEQSLKQALSRLWEESLDALIRDLHELKNEIQSQLSSFARPQAPPPRGLTSATLKDGGGEMEGR